MHGQLSHNARNMSFITIEPRNYSYFIMLIDGGRFFLSLDDRSRSATTAIEIDGDWRVSLKAKWTTKTGGASIAVSINEPPVRDTGILERYVERCPPQESRGGAKGRV